MPVNTFKRYEMKFLLTKTQFDTLIPILLNHMSPDAYCQNGKEYGIYNIYYDTADSYLIRTSLSKPYYKEKLRLRSYSAPTPLNGKVFLELKKKTAGIVNKRRAVMTLQEAYDFIHFQKYPSNTNYMNAQVQNELAYFLSQHEVSPAVYIGYKRMAYFGQTDKDFRITFDHGITARRTDLYLEKGCYGDGILENGQYLMEVKISRAIPLLLADALANLKIYKTSFSKYGMEYKNTRLQKKAEEIRITQNPTIYSFNSGLCSNNSYKRSHTSCSNCCFRLQ